MQADWIPPEPGDQGVGSDEDLQERRASGAEFAGEFGERAEAHRLPGDTSIGEDIEREEPGDDTFERERS